jgi:hypothetical protein
MEITRASAALMLAACVGAGAAGAFLGEREDAAPITAQAAAPASLAVEQSEAIVNESPAAAPSVAPATAPVVRPRTAALRPAAPARSVRQAVAAPIAEFPLPERAQPVRAATMPLEPAVRVEPEPPPALEPPAPALVDLVVPADSVLGLQIESAVTSERARVEDEVLARVTRDVRVGDRVAIPAGSRAEGEVTLVERGGKLRERARLGIRFTSLVLADGTRVPLDTETIYREGDAPGGESAAKIGGGAIGGAIIGGILGGAKGAAIGGSIGAGAGSAAVIAGGRNPATLPAGTAVTVRITDEATVTVEK